MGKLPRLAIAIALSLAAFAAQSPIDTSRSTITVYVYRAGFFSFAGDNHIVQAQVASGSLDESARQVELVINARVMRVLDPNLDPKKRAQVQERMLGPDVLDVAHFPEIKFHSRSVEAGANGTLKITGDLTLRGQTHPVTVEATGSNGHYRGSAKLKQTDFGITPITVGGGAVKVKDELKLEFEIFATGQ